MRIAYLHYHLKTGGVTTVIRQQLAAVKRHCETLVFSGRPPDPDFPAEVVHLPGLAYDTEQKENIDSKKTADEIRSAILRRWPGGCHLLHVHNPTLAKNRRLLSILKRLGAAGVRIFCQVHDFAEDGRPRVYTDDPYPEDCHWAVLNGRDRRILLSAGLRPEGVHLLSNAVRPLPTTAVDTPPGEQILYPIRAIRRKNIGEAILLSLFFPPDTALCITQPANSPDDRHSAEDWKHFVQNQRLNVRFDAGVGADFGGLVAASRFLLTTSITEGFGFSFLEAWTGGKLLWGRKLGDTCADFEKNGIRLDHLYLQLLVPTSWLKSSRFRDRWVGSYVDAHRRFGLAADRAAAESGWKTVSQEGAVDFGLLDENAQRKIIRSVIEKPDCRKTLCRLNPFLMRPGRVADAAARIEENRLKVMEHYNLDVYRETLLHAYRQASTREVRHSVDKSVVAAAFLKPETFSLLKWSPYDPEN